MSSVTSAEFRDLIGRFASGVTVATTVADGQPYGTTASAVTSVSLAPPMLLICMNKQSLTGQAIIRSGHFAVNVLGEDQGYLADHFARKGSSFAGLRTAAGLRGAPLLTDALASFECRVTDTLPAGTHTVLIGLVERASGRQGMPLAYFRGRQGRLSVPAASPCEFNPRAESATVRR
jgi:flavin reductase (DIM6/NTAB) family NADH-FMN oxidoreductase RutF